MDVEIRNSLRGVDPAAWNSLCGENNPFVEYEFLRALEVSECVDLEAGWLPYHVLVYEEGQLIAALPLYLKTHSYGEYIFDWGWAQAAGQAGLPYYPKLVSAVPFTPATGPRVLVANTEDLDRATAIASQVTLTLADELKASSVHVLFCSENQQAAFASRGFAKRLTHQFHWINQGYSDFDAFIAEFRNSARKAARKERRRAHSHGLTLETKDGADLTSREWDALYGFYCDTTSRKWGEAYLNRGFFEQIRQTFAHRVIASLAWQGDKIVAGALNFHKGQHLYGRYWGCVRDFDCLHFELCYYMPIELCIERGWQRFEAGAQGLHKLKRGLTPHATYSAHWIGHPGLRSAIEDYLHHEQREVRNEMQVLEHHGPFRRA